MSVSSTEFYATPGRHTDVTGFGLRVSSVDDAVRVVQGLLVYDLAARDLYGVELTAAQAGAVHERDAAALLELARAVDPREMPGGNESTQARVGHCIDAPRRSRHPERDRRRRGAARGARRRNDRGGARAAPSSAR